MIKIEGMLTKISHRYFTSFGSELQMFVRSSPMLRIIWVKFISWKSNISLISTSLSSSIVKNWNYLSSNKLRSHWTHSFYRQNSWPICEETICGLKSMFYSSLKQSRIWRDSNPMYLRYCDNTLFSTFLSSWRTCFRTKSWNDLSRWITSVWSSEEILVFTILV